jgi:hypothetical protein
MAADQQRPDDAPKYRSPKRSLALSFRLSRDRWKAKATQRLQQIKALRVRCRDLQTSRDLWKQKALHLQEQLQQVQQVSAPATSPPSAAPTPSQDPAPAHPAAPDPKTPPPAAPEPISTATTPTPAETADAKKKTTQDSTPLAQPTASRVPGQHYDLDRIWLCLSCILSGKASLQSVPRLLEVMESFYQLDQPAEAPDWTASRMWLMRLGLGQLRQPLVKANDWVLLLDHSIQLGRDRCLAVLGVRLSELPPGPLRRTDLRPLHLKIMRDPNMHSNYQELLQVVDRTGPPRAVLCDHGADVLGGVRLLREDCWQNRAILDLYDVKHRVAVALKHRLEPEPRWAEFLTQIGKTRNAAKQTEWAFLLPPVLRSKSRYLNLGELIRWATRTSWLIEHKPKALLEHGDAARLEEKMGWVLDFAPELSLWRQWYQVAAQTEQVVRNGGLYQGVEAEVRQRLQRVSTEAKSQDLAAELTAFVAEQSKELKQGERVPGSTQVLESCFGTLKALEKDHNRSGFTGLVLGLGALVGKVTKEVVRQALASTPIKTVRRWCAENIGRSLQSKRGEVYRLARLAGVTDLG